MSFEIKQGLFKLKITDHHAILGVSLDAEPKQIRLHYLKIAQKLHPDKCRSDVDKMKLAGQLLSKLVNPAYEQLSRQSDFAEHQLVLTQMGKRLAENKSKINLKSEIAQELLASVGSAELVYPKLLKKLTTEQYESLEQAVNNIGLISELNLVYLMLQCDRAATSGINRGIKQNPSISISNPNTQAGKQNKQDKQTVTQSKGTMTQAAASSSHEVSGVEEPTSESRVSSFIGRAQQYISRGEFDQAVTELKDALKIDPNHGVAHAVMGKAYLHKRQLTMAKVHISKAFKADPHNEIVMDSKKALEKLSKAADKSKTTKTSQSDSAQKSNSKSTNSGFFSGIFGSKKK